ncbi:MAG: 4-hydroxy-3-methylbut-2-en-1-yl diphosphate synthase [Puniceicoccaceae bacterium]|nr:MAG: 4-hydroxy-3-methylbut-2-en-1-yl diphosphate synthase [Puniceicoccaceae bacterium]
MQPYCRSRYQSLRRPTREVMVGSVGLGGMNPVRIQSMTTTDTKDVAATVAQSIALAEAGCEIVRITAPNPSAARALREIRRRLDEARIRVPLVADIHFLPSAAMEAVEHVEKVRINPGNYADRKKFAVREYSDSEYAEELERLHEAFSPLVLRCRELGRSLRIGTNHGSLSDRIMNRYGDTPLGMVESALEFIRIAESHGFHDIILSMKASNPKVMIQAYRLLVAKMDEAGMDYPLHLGVTEAGDGEDGRIKSAVGIGSLLLDGLGDTIRVSLTEDSVYEIPVARRLADRITRAWREEPPTAASPDPDGIDPYVFTRRSTAPVELAPDCGAGGDQPPRVLVPAPLPSPDPQPLRAALAALARLKDTSPEGLIFSLRSPADGDALLPLLPEVRAVAPLVVLDCGPRLPADALEHFIVAAGGPLLLLRTHQPADPEATLAFADLAGRRNCLFAPAIPAADLDGISDQTLSRWHGAAAGRLLATLDFSPAAPAAPLDLHPVGRYRLLAEKLAAAGLAVPLWIRHAPGSLLAPAHDFLSSLLDGSLLSGSLLCDGLGDILSVETENDPARAVRLAYNLLQGAGARISKTEFVACPSCGRTLFDLQTTTQRIRERTGHLKGVKIAIMGCIVNGPGEMADADFGYVGGAPGRVNLYVGKTCVQYHIPTAEAVDRLIELIRENGKWTDPEPAEASIS